MTFPRHEVAARFCKQVIPNKAYGYFPGSPIQVADPVTYTNMYSAGAIYSTGADLAKWLIALHGGHVLKPESYAEMTSADADGFGYGLKVSLQSGQKDIGHDGLIPGFISDTEYFPAMKTGIIVLTNRGYGSFTPGTHAVTSNLMSLACDEHAIVRALGGEANVDPAILQQYVGTYRLSDTANPETLRIDMIDHHLRMSLEKRLNTLMAEAPARFYMKEWDAEVAFHKDDQGAMSLDVFNYRNETRTSWRKVL